MIKLTPDAWLELLKEDGPILIFKYSSSEDGRGKVFNTLLKAEERCQIPLVYFLDHEEDHILSRSIGVTVWDISGVAHCLPQLLIFVQGYCLYHLDGLEKITVGEINSVIDKVLEVA